MLQETLQKEVTCLSCHTSVTITECTVARDMHGPTPTIIDLLDGNWPGGSIAEKRS